MDDPKRPNSGIPVGLIAGFVVMIFHLMIDMVNQGDTKADLILWFLQLLVYFFIGIIAGSQQHNKQVYDSDALRGVVEAGRTSAIILSLFMWVYIIIRSIALDDSGMFQSFGIGFSLLFGVVDFMIALGLGSLGASIIYKKYHYED